MISFFFLGWVGLGWVGLGWVGLGWVGLGWSGVGWAGSDRFGLVWAGHELGWECPASRQAAQLAEVTHIHQRELLLELHFV